MKKPQQKAKGRKEKKQDIEENTRLINYYFKKKMEHLLFEGLEIQCIRKDIMTYGVIPHSTDCFVEWKKNRVQSVLS